MTRPKIPPNPNPALALDDDEQLLPMLRRRLGGASHMQPERLLARDPTFPRPIYIGTRRFWRLGEPRAWEATLSRERSPAVSAAANNGRREAIAARKAAADPSMKELVKQIGHAVEQWPEVVVRRRSTEAEEAGIAPKVEVAVDIANRTITAADHGWGTAPETIEADIDLAQKVSSRAGYVSTTHGQQGNALQK